MGIFTGTMKKTATLLNGKRLKAAKDRRGELSRTRPARRQMLRIRKETEELRRRLAGIMDNKENNMRIGTLAMGEINKTAELLGLTPEELNGYIYPYNLGLFKELEKIEQRR